MRNNYFNFMAAILGKESISHVDENVAVAEILEKEMDAFNNMCIFGKSKKMANPITQFYTDQEVDLMKDMGIEREWKNQRWYA